MISKTHLTQITLGHDLIEEYCVQKITIGFSFLMTWRMLQVSEGINGLLQLFDKSEQLKMKKEVCSYVLLGSTVSTTDSWNCFVY